MTDPLAIPDFLKVDAAEQERRREYWKGRRLRSTNEMTFDGPADRTKKDPGTSALLAERAAQARADEKARRAAGKEARIIKARQRAKPAADAATQENDVKKAAKKKIPAKKTLADRPRSNNRTKQAKVKPGKTLASRPRSNERTAAGRPDVVGQIADMMAQPNGASMEEMVKATGIEAHPMRAKIKLVRDRLGYTTTAPSKENGYRYHAVPPKAGG